MRMRLMSTYCRLTRAGEGREGREERGALVLVQPLHACVHAMHTAAVCACVRFASACVCASVHAFCAHHQACKRATWMRACTHALLLLCLAVPAQSCLACTCACTACCSPLPLLLSTLAARTTILAAPGTRHPPGSPLPWRPRGVLGLHPLLRLCQCCHPRGSFQYGDTVGAAGSRATVDLDVLVCVTKGLAVSLWVRAC